MTTTDPLVSSEVEDYLADLPTDQREALESLRRAVRLVVPEATEVISYGVPTFRTRVGIVGYGAFADHCSLFVMSTRVVSALSHELAGYRTAKGTVRFDASEPLPESLVVRIVRARLAENDERRLH